MRVVEYVRPDGTSPFGRWFESLDTAAAAKVTTALSRIEKGNASRLKWFRGIGDAFRNRRGMMALTRDFRQTVVERMERDPSFARAMLHEAATLLLNGEPGPARLVLRDLVNATLGFEALARATGTPSKSLHRMLSGRGNPGMDKLAGIFHALCRELRVELSVHSGSAPRRPRRAA